MTYSSLITQPRWVLQSGSAERKNNLVTKPDIDAIESWKWIEPGWNALQEGNQDSAEHLWNIALKKQPTNLFLLRAVNQFATHLLQVKKRSLRAAPWGTRIAVLIPGELRCLKTNWNFFKDLSKHTDLFICTTPSFAKIARSLPAEILIINAEPNLPMGAMQQWHKLSMALQMLKSKEKTTGKRYTHILKLRTDFYYAQPRHLLRELVQADGMLCTSDKVFGGSRDLMLLFEGFYAAIRSTFDQKEQIYWPINIEPILKSDYSHKWYGMSFPRSLVGQPKSVECLRQVLKDGGSHLAYELLIWQPNAAISPDDYIRFFKGHSRFASEICFARFLNFNSISTHTCPGLTGFLRNDRITI